MSDDPSTIGLQHPAFAVSKAVLLEWLNTMFGLSYAKVEECASGAVYCQILDAIYPGTVPMKIVKWNAKNEYEWVANFKIAQKVMTTQNIAKPLPIDKLVKGKYQDNLEFLQWFKHFFECRLADNRTMQLVDVLWVLVPRPAVVRRNQPPDRQWLLQSKNQLLLSLWLLLKK